jgi:O-antigen ligase
VRARATATAVAILASLSERRRDWWEKGASSLEAPLVVDGVIVLIWIIGQLSDLHALSNAAIGAAALAALQWPATAAVLAGLVLLFPDDGHIAGGLVLVMAAGLGELIWCARRGWRLRPDLLVVAAGTLLATTGLALFATLGGAASADAIRSTFRWIGFASGLLVLPIQLMLVGQGATRSSLVLLWAVGGALALAIVEQLAQAQITASPLGNLLTSIDAARATGPFDSPNRLGTVAGMALVVGIVGIGLVRPGRAATLALICLASVAAAALILSFSRGAILGVAVALVVLAALHSRRIGLAAVVIVAVLALIVTPIVISARLGDSESRQARLAADDAQRIAAWGAGLQMFGSAPLTGEGYGSFAWVVGGSAVGPLETAHNEVISLLAEAGLFAGGAYVAMVALIAARGLQPIPERRIALGAATVFVVATMFNVQSVYPEVTVVLWTAVAFGLGTAAAPALEVGTRK